MFSILDEKIKYILDNTAFDIVKYKIITEYQIDYENIAELRQKANQSKWVVEISVEQQPDGSWGRFHTQDSKLKRKHSTTETALLRLHYLAMKRGDPIVDKACIYMERLLDDLMLWPDSWEGNKWFKPAVPLFISSKLAMFDSSNPIYSDICNKWLTILEESFRNSEYNPEKTDAVSNALLGVNIHDKYIGLNAFNNILLFSFLSEKINLDVQRKYLKWIHNKEEHISYTNITLKKEIHKINNPNELYGYLKILRLLSRFQAFKEEFSHETEWLEEKLNINGLWDFGKKVNAEKLSDNWRSETHRKTDHTVLILEILKNAYRCAV